MWILLLIAVNLNNPRDIPGKIQIKFESFNACESALKTMNYDLKFKSFKVEGKCYHE